MSTLETIPNELVFDIFKYLDPLHVLYSFSNLNYRFNKLLYSYEMYLSFTSSTINENIFRQVFAMPHIRSNVHSLILTNEKQIQSFSKTIVRKLDNLFPYIECLKIKNLRNLTNLKDLFNFSLNYLINLELYVFNISTIIEYIHFTRNSFPSLKYLSIFCKDENTPLVNNEQWNSKLVKQSLEKLDTFHFRIQFIKPTITIEQILEPFQEQFWIIDKKWIVKCDYNLDNSQYVLYTIPYGFRLMSTVTYDILETRSTLKEQSKDIDYSGYYSNVHILNLTLSCNNIVTSLYEYLFDYTKMFPNVKHLILTQDKLDVYYQADYPLVNCFPNLVSLTFTCTKFNSFKTIPSSILSCLLSSPNVRRLNSISSKQLIELIISENKTSTKNITYLSTGDVFDRFDLIEQMQQTFPNLQQLQIYISDTSDINQILKTFKKLRCLSVLQHYERLKLWREQNRTIYRTTYDNAWLKIFL